MARWWDEIARSIPWADIKSGLLVVLYVFALALLVSKTLVVFGGLPWWRLARSVVAFILGFIIGVILTFAVGVVLVFIQAGNAGPEVAWQNLGGWAVLLAIISIPVGLVGGVLAVARFWRRWYDHIWKVGGVLGLGIYLLVCLWAQASPFELYSSIEGLGKETRKLLEVGTAGGTVGVTATLYFLVYRKAFPFLWWFWNTVAWASAALLVVNMRLRVALVQAVLQRGGWAELRELLVSFVPVFASVVVISGAFIAYVMYIQNFRAICNDFFERARTGEHGIIEQAKEAFNHFFLTLKGLVTFKRIDDERTWIGRWLRPEAVKVRAAVLGSEPARKPLGGEGARKVGREPPRGREADLDLKARNLRRLEETTIVRDFVSQQLGRWNHVEWVKLLERLEREGFFPIDEAAVGQKLEQCRSEWERWRYREGEGATVWQPGRPRESHLEEKARNLKRLLETPVLMDFVSQQHGEWDHVDWVRLLQRLKREGFWPIDVPALSAKLDQCRLEWRLQRAVGNPRTDSEAKARNLERLARSALLSDFVKEKQGEWDHQGWLELLGRLRREGYWPVDEDAVAAQLVKCRTEWLSTKSVTGIGDQ
jgi:hypothetical protein